MKLDKKKFDYNYITKYTVYKKGKTYNHAYDFTYDQTHHLIYQMIKVWEAFMGENCAQAGCHDDEILTIRKK